VRFDAFFADAAAAARTGWIASPSLDDMVASSRQPRRLPCKKPPTPESASASLVSHCMSNYFFCRFFSSAKSSKSNHMALAASRRHYYGARHF
jgi:hypothetical protein